MNAVGLCTRPLSKPSALALLVIFLFPRACWAAEGASVWNAQPYEVVYDKPIQRPLPSPIRIAGARNGAFSGMVVVKATGGVRASFDGFKGPGTIPASAVRIRYGMLAVPGFSNARDRKARFFDGLADTPSAGTQVMPVWLTVKVPADATPGAYTGKVSIAATGIPKTEVPVQLEVCGWVMPDANDFRLMVDFMQSPESVAMQYGTPRWSKKHFDLIGQSFKLLGSAGNKTVYLPLICQTNLGNDETLVRWRANGQPDFSRFDSYLAACAANMGKPRVCCLQVWEVYLEGEGHGIWKSKDTRARVTAPDGAMIKGPSYSDPKAEAFWKPVADGILSRMKKRGWEDALTLGISTDKVPGKQIVDFWKKLLPGVPWMSMSHGRKLKVQDARVKYATVVWSGWMPNWSRHKDRPKERRDGWRLRPIIRQDRDFYTYPTPVKLLLSRIRPEQYIMGTYGGVGRLPADFWPVIKGKRTSFTLALRYTTWRNLNIRERAYLAPGPNGPCSTARFEMMRESIQEAEARVLIETAINDKDKSARLGEDLCKSLRKVLDQRLRMVVTATRDEDKMGAPSRTPYMRKDDAGARWFISIADEWRQSTAALFNAAGDVSEKLGIKYVPAGKAEK